MTKIATVSMNYQQCSFVWLPERAGRIVAPQKIEHRRDHRTYSYLFFLLELGPPVQATESASILQGSKSEIVHKFVAYIRDV